MVLSFSTELAASGTKGTAPGWGPLMRGCGFAEVIVANTSVTYNPISTAMESLWFELWIGSTKHALKGSRGTGVITLNAQGVPVIRWTYTGLWSAPSEASPATPTLTAFKKPLIVNSANLPTFTINSVALKVRSHSLDFGNDVQVRELENSDEIVIVDHIEQFSAVVEAVPLTTFDPFALANAQTLVPLSFVLGTVAGSIITVSAPTSQMRRPTGYQNNQGILEWPLSLGPLPNAGNDQFTLALT